MNPFPLQGDVGRFRRGNADLGNLAGVVQACRKVHRHVAAQQFMLFQEDQPRITSKYVSRLSTPVANQRELRAYLAPVERDRFSPADNQVVGHAVADVDLRAGGAAVDFAGNGGARGMLLQRKRDCRECLLLAPFDAPHRLDGDGPQVQD